MKLASANKIRPTTKAQPKHQASTRVILLAVVSFGLGVAATVGWFQLAASRDASNAGSRADNPPAAGSPTVPVPVNAANPLPVDPAAVAAVKQAIPNLDSVSLADGEKILRAAAMKEFGAAARETDGQVQAARQQLLQAQNGQSAAEQQAAMKRLQETQTAAADKLQQIAAQLSARIAALESLKTSR